MLSAFAFGVVLLNHFPSCISAHVTCVVQQLHHGFPCGRVCLSLPSRFLQLEVVLVLLRCCFGGRCRMSETRSAEWYTFWRWCQEQDALCHHAQGVAFVEGRNLLSDFGKTKAPSGAWELRFERR